jgi:DNA-binding MarR family transcriptional regulator
MSISRPEEEERGPTLGAMFRLIHSAMVQEYARWLETTGYHDIRPAHAAVLQPLWQRPEGERLTTLASIANITKQSAGALVDSLVASGYVERVPDPQDARAIRIRLTARGRRYARDVRGFGHELEARLARQLGAGKLRNLRSTLDLLWKALQSGS